MTGSLRTRYGSVERMTKRSPVIEYVRNGKDSFYRVLAGNGATMLTSETYDAPSKAKRAALRASAVLGGLPVREGDQKA